MAFLAWVESLWTSLKPQNPPSYLSVLRLPSAQRRMRDELVTIALRTVPRCSQMHLPAIRCAARAEMSGQARLSWSLDLPCRCSPLPPCRQAYTSYRSATDSGSCWSSVDRPGRHPVGSIRNVGAYMTREWSAASSHLLEQHRLSAVHHCCLEYGRSLDGTLCLLVALSRVCSL